MKIGVISVPHSGTHFMHWHLLADVDHYVSHCFPATREHWRSEAARCDLVIVPLRHPLAIAKSWKNRQRRLAEELPAYLDELQRFIDSAPVSLLTIDQPRVRDSQLERINRWLYRHGGAPLDAEGWPVVRQPDAYQWPGLSLTPAERAEIPFTDPFRRFYDPWTS